MTPAAMIFAAGFGTRMGDLTKTTPKPMLQLAGRPLIDHSIDHLRAAGINRIVANTHYLADCIAPHLKDAGIKTSHEDPILETGGGLRTALPLLGPSPVITLNPDVAWNGPNPVSELLANWRDDMQALLMLTPSPDGAEADDFSLEQGELRRSGPYRYTGLQLIQTHRLHDIETPVFSLNAYWDMLSDAGPLHGCIYSGKWRDVGTPEGLMAAEDLLSS